MLSTTKNIFFLGLFIASFCLPVKAATEKPNIVLIISDDQRWDKITPKYMPNVYKHFVQNGLAFKNAFAPNPLCCPSRTSILTGNYSHTTGVWTNTGPFGGFYTFDDKHTMAVDFQLAGYRTAMIGKYLNDYEAGENLYIPPGWDNWFATNGAVYYNYAVSTNKGRQYYGSTAKDYIARVLSNQAINFVTNLTSNKPFFLYYSFTAPHGPAIPDPRDVGRFAGETDFDIDNNMLASAFSMDREIGRLFAVLPSNTVLLYMSDNGFLWREPKGDWGRLRQKRWPYNESIRIPIYLTSINVRLPLKANLTDIVLNIDLRKSLAHIAGIKPITKNEGTDWFAPTYKPRKVFPLTYYKEPTDIYTGEVPTYCGAREKDFMYVRYQHSDNTYTEELYNNPAETNNLIGNSLYQTAYKRLKSSAKRLCNPTPPGYSW